jgi:hypothetical protein
MLIHLNLFKARIKNVPILRFYGDKNSSMRLREVLITFPFYLVEGGWCRLYQRHVFREFSPVVVFRSWAHY